MTRDLLTEAYGAMKHNRRRTALTMLGMAWGIATVVILLAFGSGFEQAISLIFSSWGTDVIGAFPGRTSLQVGGAKAGTEIRLQLADVDYVRNEVPMVKGVTPIFDKRGVTIQHDNRTYTNLFLTGVFPVYERIRGFAVATGRGLSEDDQLQRARVAVIGDEARRRLFSGQPPLGQMIRINGLSFEVVGVYERKVQGGDDNDNTLIAIPFSTMGDLYDTRYISGIFMDYDSMGNGWIWFNVSKPPFDNKKVRQAIAYGLDKEKVLKAVYWGLGEIENNQPFNDSSEYKFIVEDQSIIDLAFFQKWVCRSIPGFNSIIIHNKHSF